MEAEKDPTTRFYRENAAPYAASSAVPSVKRLEAFLTRLQPGAEILELGCGNGRDSAAMMERGFRPTPTDGTPEMAAEASRRLAIPVRTLRFDDIDMVSAFDGVWANACLLHVPRADLGGILSRIHRALRPSGMFYASFKAGEAEGYDGFGRFFNYPSRDWLLAAYDVCAWSGVTIDAQEGGGYDNQPTQWLHVTAVKAP